MGGIKQRKIGSVLIHQASLFPGSLIQQLTTSPSLILARRKFLNMVRGIQLYSGQEKQNGWLQLRIIGPNVELILSPSETFEYVNQIEKYGDFDIIIIDGTGDSRLPCTEMAKKHIRKGGMIILDNSDLWVDSAANLRKDDRFIQVDFTSFAPIVSNACTTSIFFTRDFRVNPLGNRQPHKSVAQPAEQWREDRSVWEKMKK
jgi:hypothetical protein